MINAAGLIRNWQNSGRYFPTIRCRFVLDFTRKLMIEIREGAKWPGQTTAFFEALDMQVLPPPKGPSRLRLRQCQILPLMLVYASFCKSQFGRDLLTGL